MNNTEGISTPRIEKKKWTLMFFFASDNALSPSTLPQIKAIRAAGSQADTNVLVYFDPNERGAPTRVFDINRNDNSDPSRVSVLANDYISPEEMSALPGAESQQFATSLAKNIDTLNADEALEQFLGFCRESYPADHYMLFLLGHGLVVGRDAFLPDDNPNSAIGLKRAGEILKKFSTDIGNEQVLELIGMHSCSMSAVEVAYELKGTARYMLGSQGLSFVGSWPYRQMLTEIYKAVGQRQAVNVGNLVKTLHTLCIGYSVDFMYAGYSSDICLCSLAPEHVQALTDPISNLSQALQNGVADPRCRDLIVLAHWKSQSYWQEMYTDLYDFCLCLSGLCKQPKRNQLDENAAQYANREYDSNRHAIIRACDGVIDKLKPENGRVNGPVVCTDFVGPDVQYSHGLSIYFPWSHPIEDENDQVIKNYKNYAFTAAMAEPLTWLKFLNTYFNDTLRESRLTEEDGNPKYRNQAFQAVLDTARESFQTASTATSRDFFPTGVLEGKVSPSDSGGGCSCASTKNYSRDFAMSPGALTAFVNNLARGASGRGSRAQSVSSSS